MTEHDEMSDEFRTELRDAVEERAAGETDWTRFHSRLSDAVAARLDELRRRTSGAYRATAGVGAAWWDYAARLAVAAVPLGLAAAIVLFTYLRSTSASADIAQQVVATQAPARRNADSARAAFESVLTGSSAPQAAMAALIPVPAAFLADSSGGSRK